MKANKARRHELRTVLLVCEGYAEVAFIEHLKALYVSRGCGLALTVKNARGKGALHVVDVAIRQSRNAAFDVKAALLDTDTGWNDTTQAIARKAKVQVLACNPCIEAMLLALHGDMAQGRSTAQYKQVFVAKFDVPAHEASLYAKHFTFEFLEKARLTSPVLEELLTLLKSTEK
jgi:hypothetical protein